MEDIVLLKEKLERIKLELNRLYLVGTAMQTTLKLDEILFIILTGVTAKEGLGFNRAMLFLVNENTNTLDGEMGIGPQSGEEAAKIWSRIETEKITFDDLIKAYKNFDSKSPSPLNMILKTIKIPLEEDYCILSMTALEDMPFEVMTQEAKNKVNPKVKELLKLDEFVTVPLKSKDKAIGILLADNKFSGKSILKEDIKILSMFANQAGLAIENSRLYEEKEKMSQVDSLTGLYNHGFFQSLLNTEIKRALRFKQPVSLIMLDIDHFKVYNDIMGHQAGDDLLKTISKILLENLRELDQAARYGGEEFVIILPQTSKNDAALIAERLRKNIEEFDFIGKESLPDKKVTISLGLATLPQDAPDKNGLIYQADTALYKAKGTGRNKLYLAPPF